MSTSFTPSSPLERLVHAGDYAGTLAFLRPLTEVQRRRHGSEVVRMHELIREHRWKDPKATGLRWDAHPTREQERVAEAALVLCGSPKAIAESWVGAEHLIELARGFSLSYIQEVAEALLHRGAPMIRVVQPLVAEGLIERPDSDEYALGLIGLPGTFPREMTLQHCFEADPGLKRALLRMFDVEGNADTSLASAEKYRKTRKGWADELLELCRDGVFTREELLDRTLSALERDWPQYRSGWFSRFHEELAPTLAEMSPHLERYLHLLGSRIPPTVGLALKCVLDLAQAGRLDAASTLPALRPVFGRGNKQQVETALKLLDRCVAANADYQEEACVLACAGLVSDAPPLQKKLLQFVAKHPASPRIAEALARHAEGIAASNLPFVDPLLSEFGSESKPVRAGVSAAVPVLVDSNPLAESRRLSDVDTIDALVELVAFALENGNDPEAFERAATGVVARHPFSHDELSKFGPVLKRAKRVKSLLPGELARLLLFVCRGERVLPLPDPEGYNPPNRALRLVRQRIDALIEFAPRAKHLTPLATPTHRRGFIEPSVLIERMRRQLEADVPSPAFEQELALLRLGPATSSDRELAGTLPDSPLARALRRKLDDSPRVSIYPWRTNRHSGDYGVHYSLHVDPPASIGKQAIVAARHPDPKSTAPSYHRRLQCGSDAGVIGYFALLVPGDLEPFFAEGARSMGNNLDWWEACWQDKAYLAPLLDPSVQLGEMAMLALVCALVGKEPGQAAVAVDCIVQSHREGRLDPGLFAEVHSRFALQGMARLARLRKSFDSALRIEPSIEIVVVRVIEHLLQEIGADVPRDLAKLLELLNEICIASGRGLSFDTSEALSAMRLGGAAVSLRKGLLARSAPFLV